MYAFVPIGHFSRPVPSSLPYLPCLKVCTVPCHAVHRLSQCVRNTGHFFGFVLFASGIVEQVSSHVIDIRSVLSCARASGGSQVLAISQYSNPASL